MSLPNLEAASRMRELPLDARNAAIEAGENVLDLRQTLGARIKQRVLAMQYKSARQPNGKSA